MIVDGILVLNDSQLCELMDLKVFVDVPSDLRFIRRLDRDINERGRSVKSVTEQYLATVRPMHEKFVEPSKKNADILIPGGGNNVQAIKVLSALLHTLPLNLEFQFNKNSSHHHNSNSFSSILRTSFLFLERA